MTTKFAKTAPIGNNTAGYDVIVDGTLVGKVFRYDGQSARRAYTDWSAYLVDEDGVAESQAVAIKATRQAAVSQLLERRAQRIVQVVAESIDNLKDQEFDSEMAWEFIDLAAANLSKEGTRSASFDGLYDALVTNNDGVYRLALTDLEEIRKIVQENTL